MKTAISILDSQSPEYAFRSRLQTWRLLVLAVCVMILNPSEVLAGNKIELPEYSYRPNEAGRDERRHEYTSGQKSVQQEDGFLPAAASFDTQVFKKTISKVGEPDSKDSVKLFDSLSRQLKAEMTIDSYVRQTLFSEKYTVLVGAEALYYFDESLTLNKKIPYPDAAYPPARPRDVALSASGRHFFYSGGWIWDDEKEEWRRDLAADYFFQAPLLKVSDRFIVQTDVANMHCVFVRALNAPSVGSVKQSKERQICPSNGLFGLGADDLHDMRFLDDTHLLVVFGDDYKSCVFDLETLQRGECWSESFINLDSDINRGLFYRDSGEWSVYQLTPKKLIGTGTLMDAKAFNEHPWRSTIAADFRSKGWLMGPAPGLIEQDQRLVSFFDEESETLSIIDLKNGRLAGRQTIKIERNAGLNGYTTGVYFWGTSISLFHPDGTATDFELVLH